MLRNRGCVKHPCTAVILLACLGLQFQWRESNFSGKISVDILELHDTLKATKNSNIEGTEPLKQKLGGGGV
jgi:hypothetical protein